MNQRAFLPGILYANSTLLLKWAIGFNYFSFGMLKFVNGLSPAESLAKNTIHALTFGMVPDSVNYLVLAIWEVSIGALFISGRFIRFGAKAAIVHMVFTFAPFFLFPEVTFSHDQAYGFTIVGQYILKNLVFMAALLIILKEGKSAPVVLMGETTRAIEMNRNKE